MSIPDTSELVECLDEKPALAHSSAYKFSVTYIYIFLYVNNTYENNLSQQAFLCWPGPVRVMHACHGMQDVQ